jgi:hypothetical protein
MVPAARAGVVLASAVLASAVPASADPPAVKRKFRRRIKRPPFMIALNGWVNGEWRELDTSENGVVVGLLKPSSRMVVAGRNATVAIQAT